ncbi:hypothetical protein ATCR1_06901 [Agrobacterium tumefaciens CCNWGS0286]|nr:hypothetical protein ATCR1_06901 [Agrobacterium tumefaciens CCNWGS0286]
MRKKSQEPVMQSRECPDDCSGGSQSRQGAFAFDTVRNLPDETKAMMKEMVPAPTRCTYCGCVYSRGDFITKLGWYNNGILGGGWHPAR